MSTTMRARRAEIARRIEAVCLPSRGLRPDPEARSVEALADDRTAYAEGYLDGFCRLRPRYDLLAIPSATHARATFGISATGDPLLAYVRGFGAGFRARGTTPRMTHDGDRS